MKGKKYDHGEIEKKWQKKWAEKNVYKTSDDFAKPKFYVLDMFPYPSGEGLHVGHPKGYIATDIISRMKRMQGFNVLHPMGFDAFGLPAENYAIKTKTNPRISVAQNVERYKKQLEIIGFDYDWSREVNTTDPGFYKWTQWIFLKLLEKGLAYESNEPVNWCPNDKTVLANEDVEDGKCERCGAVIEKKPMRQWVLKITDYAERLLEDLDMLDWPESIKESQRNWIGRSVGSEINFPLELEENDGPKPNYLILHGYKGSSHKNFIPWLKKDLEKKGFLVQTPELPGTDTPHETEQVEYVIKNCDINEHTIIVGHSLGVVVGLKVLQKIKKSIAGFVAVASAIDPQFIQSQKISDIDSEERPFWKNFSWDYDYEYIKRHTTFRKVVSDTNERDNRKEYLKFLSEKLSAELIEIKSQEEHFCADVEPAILNSLVSSLPVFTTRADTLFGATALILSPEHKWVTHILDSNYMGVLKNESEVREYVEQAQKKTEIDRTDASKEKTGVKLEGVSAINPANSEKIPVFIADYVLADYGTGAVMSVPAHDERDFAFAQKYNVPLRHVVAPRMIDHANPHVKGKEIVFRKAVIVIVQNPKTKEIINLNWKKQSWTTFVMGGVEDGEDIIEAAKREVVEETGYKNLKFIRVLGGPIQSEFFAAHKDVNRVAHTWQVLFELENEERGELSDEESAIHEVVWVNPKKIQPKTMAHVEADLVLERLQEGEKPFMQEGIILNSGQFDRMDSEDAKKAITEFVGGKIVVKYKLRDWVFSRQRYWGEPIPVLFETKPEVKGHESTINRKAIPVAEDDLPVELPSVESYEPTGTGESPLANIKDWVEVNRDGTTVYRETNTMPQWAGSSWYYLRYMDPHNKKKLVDSDKEKYWNKVDLYVGGAEHATRHLIYARFWHKFLYDIGVVADTEPFQKLQSVGLILAKDGRKMSKRFGNVVNPDEIVNLYGADSLRLYEMFMGPFDQVIPWSTDNIIGVRRFLEKVWRLEHNIELGIKNKGFEKKESKGDVYYSKFLILLHKTIKKVTEDIGEMRFNTAVSSMMVLVNEMEDRIKNNELGIKKEDFEIFLKLLSPFAPHIAEELWQNMGNTTLLVLETWPVADMSKLQDSEVVIVIQVNGKVRGQVIMAVDSDESTILDSVEAQDELKKWIGSNKPKKVVYIKNRLINLVV